MSRIALIGALTASLVLTVGCRDEQQEGRPPDSLASRRDSPAVKAPVDIRRVRADALIRASGWGRIHFGMTVDEMQHVRPDLVIHAKAEETCYHVRAGGDTLGGRPGILLMIVDERVVRVEVDDTVTITAAGARVGDTEERIKQLYPGQVHSQPHKYVDGHYLIVYGGDGAYRIVFETDGTRVTRYRAGRYPEVEWIEGCS